MSEIKNLVRDMKIACGSDSEVIKKYEQDILDLNDASLSYEFCKNVIGANIKAHEKIILDSKDESIIFHFLENFTSDCDQKPLAKYLLDNNIERYCLDIASLPNIDATILNKCVKYLLDEYEWSVFGDLAAIPRVDATLVAKRVIDQVKIVDSTNEALHNPSYLFRPSYQDMIVKVAEECFNNDEIVSELGDIIAKHGDQSRNLEFAIKLDNSDVIKHAKAYINRGIEEADQEYDIPQYASLSIIKFADGFNHCPYNTKMRLPLVFLESEIIKYNEPTYIDKFINQSHYKGRLDMEMYEDWLLKEPKCAKEIMINEVMDYLFNRNVSSERILKFDDYVSKYGKPKEHAIMIRYINYPQYKERIKKHDQKVIESEDFNANCICASYRLAGDLTMLDTQAHLKLIYDAPVEEYTEAIIDVLNNQAIEVNKKLIAEKILASNNARLIIKYGATVKDVDLVKVYRRLTEIKNNKDFEDNYFNWMPFERDYLGYYNRITRELENNNIDLNNIDKYASSEEVDEAQNRVDAMLLQLKNQ